MNTNFETDDVMQTLEDAFIKELQQVFPENMKIFSNTMNQKIPKESIMLVLKTMNMARDRNSAVTRRRTVMFDIAVVTSKSEYWVENRLMEIASVKFGEIEKVFTSSRFSRVDGVTHMTGYFYLTEVQHRKD
ncbi:Uncharacterized protein B5E38_4988 [Bacillus cereus]|nr:Uncharacterized protein B5E38_4988 [Bacillus cereus]ARO65075.1 Uncharacterized protein B5E39_2704 [Bacillus cereus]